MSLSLNDDTLIDQKYCKEKRDKTVELINIFHDLKYY